MSTAAETSEVPSSSMRRDFRLSPRCIITKSSSSFDSGITSAFPKLENSVLFHGANEQQIGYGNHPLPRSNSNKHLESKMAFHTDHARQDSALSSTSNEILHYAICF